MTMKPIHFIRRGEVVTLENVPPTRTLLQVLREDLKCVGTKEGCNEGDCGACTVVIGDAIGNEVRYQTVNSCIRFAHAIDGKALWTVEDIAQADGSLHPAQQSMVDCFGSQCGFCTPGFVMSLYATYQNRVCKGETVTRESALHDLSGNLCRCTGYRPILDAAEAMAALPPVRVDSANLVRLLKALPKANPTTPLAQTPNPRNLSDSSGNAAPAYFLPQSLANLLQVRAAHPTAQIVAGGTDVGLWVNKLHMDFAQVIDITQTTEIKRVETYPNHVAIGAGASLNDAFAALVRDRPQLKPFADRFAGLPVRNSGTLGGNVVNGSPIGDSMPLLIALQSSIVLMHWAGGRIHHRELRIENFYTGYRKNTMLRDEVLAWIKVPLPSPHEFLRAYKISKRFEDDISAVCLVVSLHFEGGHVSSASIGVGGVAATPVRAVKAEGILTGKPWTQHTVDLAKAALGAEFSPISDMRASSGYRSLVLGNLLQRFWLESQGETGLNLETLDGAEEVAL